MKLNKPTYKQVIIWAGIANFLYGVIEVIGGYYFNSVGLLADSFDFFADSFSFYLSLWVMHRSENLQNNAAKIKAGLMIFGAFVVFGQLITNIYHPQLPSYQGMIGLAVMAFIINGLSSWGLMQYKNTDANRLSLWLCSRNDTINNFMTFVAGGLIYFFPYPIFDYILAGIFMILAYSGAVRIIMSINKPQKAD